MQAPWLCPILLPYQTLKFTFVATADDDVRGQMVAAPVRGGQGGDDEQQVAGQQIVAPPVQGGQGGEAEQ
jgi:hypothetical protein